MVFWWLSAASGLLPFAPVRCEKSLSPGEVAKWLQEKESFSAYFADSGENETCANLPEPVFRLASQQRKQLEFGSKTKCAMFRRVAEGFFRSEFSGEKHQVQKWIQTFTSPVIEVKDEATLHELFLSRKPDRHLDSLVVTFIPQSDAEKFEIFNELALRALTEDATSHALLTEGKTHQRFLVVRDKDLAEKLQITPETYLGEHTSDLIVYRYYNPESQYGRHTLEDYRPLEQIQGQTIGYMKHHFAYPASIRQLRLKLLRDKFILKRHTEGKLDYSSMRKAFQPFIAEDLSDLAGAVARVKPLIRPLVSVKDVSMILFPMLIEIMRTKKPVLVLSVKEGNPAEAAQQIHFRKVAETFAEKVIPIVTTPRIFSHSHIKHVHLRHQNILELRLYVMSSDEYPTVSQQYRFTAPLHSATPDDISAWVESCLAGAETPHLESEPIKPEERILCAENWAEVASYEEAWIWVGSHIPTGLKSLKNIFRLPEAVELPFMKLQPGLYRVKSGTIARMPGF